MRTTSDGKYTAEHLKYLVLQYCGNPYDTKIGMVPGIHSLVLAGECGIDTDTTNAFSLGEGPDLHTILGKSISTIERLDDLKRTLLYYLNSPGTEEMHKEVVALVNDDMTARGIFVKKPESQSATLWQKATILVQDIAEANITQAYTNVNVDLSAHNENENKHGYCVHLMTLINGWAECPRVDRLYLTTMNSFGAFLSVLKEETRHCVIPPENKVYPKLSWSSAEVEEDEMDIREGTTTNGGLGEHAANGNSSVAARDINARETLSAVPRDVQDKGYGLADGPWMYRLQQVEDQPKPDWGYIRNQTDYMKMLDQVKAINRRCEEWKVKERCTIMVIHLQDMECLRRLEKKKEEEKAWSKEMAKELKAQGFYDSDDDNDGESWYDWWARNDTLEKEAERNASQKTLQVRSRKQ
ncbi:hypothetical protein ACMFMG_003794 [Clarireedia jacksonii]